MSELTKKAVVDTKASFEAAVDATVADVAADAFDAAAAAAYAAAWDAWSKAKQELEDYLKEQDNE